MSKRETNKNNNKTLYHTTGKEVTRNSGKHKLKFDFEQLCAQIKIKHPLWIYIVTVQNAYNHFQTKTTCSAF